MRILQVCNHYYPSVGGVGSHVRSISERLAQEHDVTVFTTDSSGMQAKEEEINGVQVRRFSCFSPDYAYYISLKMWRELRGCRFDIVHGHNYHALPLFFSRYAARKKFIVTPHYHRHGVTKFRDVLIKFYKPLGKRIFQEADRVIAVSNYERDLLMEDFQMNGNKIVVIPNGVDIKAFRSLKKEDKDHKTILCVSRLEEFKGIQYAIQALPLLGEDFRLEIVGRGAYKGTLIRLATELGVMHRLDFYQDLRGKDLLDRYAGADVFVLLSQHEAMAIVIAEALAARVPCIVANTTALREWIDNENCFGIDYPVCSSRLAEMVARLAGREVGEVELWDWDQIASETARVYEE
jgi:glycosyltransferase involved in cell wall biosynthesis